MSNDLHLSSPQFEWLLRAFYITYLGFEWMALMWKLVPPHIYRISHPHFLAMYLWIANDSKLQYV